MALNSYSALKTAVSDQLARTISDGDLSDCVTLTEAKVQRNLRDLNMETRATATTTAYLSFPTDMLSIRDIQINVNGVRSTLEMVSPSELDRRYSASTGVPRAYCLIANQIQFGPDPDQSYTVEIVYYKKVPALSNSATTNWLLSAWPDLYLYGCCFEACAKVRDSDGAMAYKGMFGEVMGDLLQFERRQRWSGSPMATRPA